MKISKLISVSAVLVLSMQLLATPLHVEKSGDVDEAQNELSSADALPVKKVPSLTDWQREFEDKFNVKIGQTEDGKTFFFGESVVRVGPLDPAYGKELTLTYDKAMLNLLQIVAI
ncbi:MAG: hypothetical protein U9N42_00230 [Campylobacterota bacterium]|nr:hypothetical protein [Campylobacterota bacterium]